MIFHGRIFLLITYPLLCLLFHFIPRFRLQIIILFSLSLVAINGKQDLFLLMISILINYFISRIVLRSEVQNRKKWFYFSLLFNLSFLFICKIKYDKWLAGVIPLGVSFYTFQQIGFQFDLFRKRIKHTLFSEYLFIISFFPHLAAGPIIVFKNLSVQIRSEKWKTHPLSLTIPNLSLLVIGLAKKVLIADQISPHVSQAYSLASNLHPQLNLEHFLWSTFGYGFEIYFDFSGYSDIAMALALILGIELPLNFNSPYKSQNIIEFWRRWHISLSSFIREYFYNPLRERFVSTYSKFIIIFFVMTIVGLWHGVGWMFLLWGLAHGILLATNHFFNHINYKLPKFISFLLTYVSVNLLWILFKNANFNSALRLLQSAQNPVFTNKSFILAFLFLAVTRAPNSIAIFDWVSTRFEDQRKFLRSLYLFCLILTGVLVILFSEDQNEFIYFRF